MKTLSTLNLSAKMTCILAIAFLSVTGFCEEKKATQEEETASEKPRDWESIKLDGKNYVTDSNIAKFYQFQRFTHDTKNQSASFYQPASTLKLNADGKHREIRINRIRIELIDKTVWDAEHEQLLLSTRDLALTLDPVVRPSYIKIKDWVKEREKPIHFVIKGDSALVKAIDEKKLIAEAEARGLKIVTEEGKSAANQIELVFKTHDDGNESNRISTDWFWKKDDRDSRRLSIALGVALHSHLAHLDFIADDVLRPKEVAADESFPARARLVFTLNETFLSFPQIHRAIADALVKYRTATGQGFN